MTTAATLLRHPATRCDAVHAIDVRVHRVASQRETSTTLVLNYVLKGDMSLIRVPPLAPDPGRADGLWKHTCFEAFVATPGVPGYYELNFSPSREWAIYRFDAYREGMAPVDLASPPQLSVQHLDDRLEMAVSVQLPDAKPVSSTLRLALSAVVEDGSGTLSYWALRHAPAKADFHHPDSFVLELPL